MYLLALHPAIEERVRGQMFKKAKYLVIVSVFSLLRKSTSASEEWSRRPQRKCRISHLCSMFSMKLCGSTLQVISSPNLFSIPNVHVVPFDMRRPIEDDVLPNGAFVPAGVYVLRSKGIKLKKTTNILTNKTDVVYSAFILGRSEKLWDDAETFRPDRWEHPEDIRKDAFLPFHTGPQTCMSPPLNLLMGVLTIISRSWASHGLSRGQNSPGAATPSLSLHFSTWPKCM